MIWLIVGAILLTSGVIFYLWYPPFGGRTRKAAFISSSNHNKQKFQNTQPVRASFSRAELASLIRRQSKNRSSRKPDKQLIALWPDFTAFQKGSELHVIWLGHSTILARIGGQTVLFDPVFSKRASPFQWIGPKRFNTAPQLQVADLPPIDIVVISHDHYDHLDYHSIKKLAAKTRRFFVPLGVKAHLKRWGVTENAVTELDWWQEAKHNSLTFAFTPAQHFSGRRLADRAATLWGSWVVRTKSHKLFFSGDGAYGPHFKQIGQKYGPFDLTLLECGQYDVLWSDVHMMPEQTVQAHIDLRGKRMIPIHWGAFVLALHPWKEPVERAVAAAQKTKSVVLTPKIGEIVAVV